MFMDQCENVIAVQECASGNESVGTEWLETKSFSKNATLEEVMKWADDRKGRLMLCWDK
jgi:hypothetical protein